MASLGRRRMLTLKYLLEVVGGTLLAAGAAMLLYDLYRIYHSADTTIPPRWRAVGRIAMLGLIPLLAGISIQIVPAGMAGVRVSQISGALPESLYPGLHFVVPLVQNIALYDARDQIYQT